MFGKQQHAIIIGIYLCCNKPFTGIIYFEVIYFGANKSYQTVLYKVQKKRRHLYKVPNWATLL